MTKAVTFRVLLLKCTARESYNAEVMLTIVNYGEKVYNHASRDAKPATALDGDMVQKSVMHLERVRGAYHRPVLESIDYATPLGILSACCADLCFQLWAESSNYGGLGSVKESVGAKFTADVIQFIHLVV